MKTMGWGEINEISSVASGNINVRHTCHSDPQNCDKSKVGQR